MKPCSTCGRKRGHRTGCIRKPKSGSPKKDPEVPPEPPGPYTEPPRDGMRQLLRDMMHVWYNDPSHDLTQGQKRARVQLNKDDTKFFGLMSKLEREIGVAGGGEGRPQKVDEGSERCEVLIERLLKKFYDTHPHIPRPKMGWSKENDPGAQETAGPITTGSEYVI
jgi:hypothetical protein